MKPPVTTASSKEDDRTSSFVMVGIAAVDNVPGPAIEVSIGDALPCTVRFLPLLFNFFIVLGVEGA